MWDLLIIDPMTNALLWLYGLLGQNFVLAITVFTLIIRVITLPLNLRQQRSSLRMQEMQPQIRAIQQKHKDNPQKMQEEFQKIGYNPAETLTGCLPLLIQMPILFGLFQVLGIVLGSTPQSLFELTRRVYEGIDLTRLLPIDSRFLWMNLGQPDPFYVLPILVLVTMFVQQKFLSPAPQKKSEDKDKKQDDPMSSMTQSMQYTMPIMFGFFSLQFQAGLSIYFVLSNIIGIAQGVYMKRAVSPPQPGQKSETAVSMADTPPEATLEESLGKNGAKSGDESRPKSQRKRSQSKRKRRSAKR